MGRLVNGINGPIVGKVGTVIGSSYKGVPYLKGPYKSRTPKISDTEKGNRSRFSMAQSWLKPLLEFVRVGFKGYGPVVEGFIAAKSHLMKNAMEGTGAGSIINPAKVKVSFGELPLPDNIAVKLIEGNKLEFMWDAKSIPHRFAAHDQVMLLAYDIKNKKAEWTTTGQFRNVGRDILELPEEKGRTYHVYLAFVAHDRSCQSGSVYLGEVTV